MLQYLAQIDGKIVESLINDAGQGCKRLVILTKTPFQIGARSQCVPLSVVSRCLTSTAVQSFFICPPPSPSHSLALARFET